MERYNMDPINYSGMQTQPNIGQNFGQGFQLGSAIQEIQQKAEARKAALDRQAKMQIDVHKTFTNPNATPDEIAYIAATYPEISENVTKAWSLRDSASKDASLKAYIPAYSAVLSGKPDVASQLLNERATALKNAGRTEEANQLFQQAELITSDPAQAKNVFGLQLSAIMGPEKFAETYSKLSTEQRAADSAPVELRTKEAEATIKEAQADNAGELEAAKASEQLSKATTAQIEADNADEKAAIDLRKGAADATTAEVTAANAPKAQRLQMDKTQQDIFASKENSRIAAINAAINREGNGLKRKELELKLADAKIARDQKIADKEAEITTTLGGFGRTLNTIDKLKKHPGLSKAVGWQASYPTMAGTDAADFESVVESLQSQAFLSEISKFKGMGALSDSEGKKLNTAIANLSIKQSEKGFKDNLDTIEKIITDAEKTAAKKFGVSVPDRNPPKTESKLTKGNDGKLRYGF